MIKTTPFEMVFIIREYMKERIVLYADDGKMLTDGTIYGKQIFLAEGADKSVYYEIPETAGVYAMENTITEEE